MYTEEITFPVTDPTPRIHALRHALRRATDFAKVLEQFHDEIAFHPRLLPMSRGHHDEQLTRIVGLTLARMIGEAPRALLQSFGRVAPARFIHGSVYPIMPSGARRHGIVIYFEDDMQGLCALVDQPVQVMGRFSLIPSPGALTVSKGGVA